MSAPKWLTETERLRAGRMTGTQLATTVRTYARAAAGSPNGRWRDVCRAELERREGDT